MTETELKDITNSELAALLLEIKESNKNIVVLTDEEVKYLREMIEDRQAVTRVWSKAKMFLLSFAAVVIAWGTLADTFKNFIKRLFS
jgi:uncharacterized membrane protein